MDRDEYQALLARSRSKQAKPGKYHAVPTAGYASRKEARRAAQLQLLQRAGHISGLRQQVPFQLIPAQYSPDGKLLERACSYIADFVYHDAEGRLVVEDTKGMRTDVYIIKRKLMLHVHGIAIREV